MIENIYEQLEIPEEHRLTSIGKEEGEFIYDLLQDCVAKDTLETGFAYGCSAAYIISATKGKHTAIDPFEDGYENLGFKNIEKLGLTKYLNYIKSRSQLALPRLVEEKFQIDFGFIDGGHKYEEILIDWFYIDKLLRKGGYVAFHDAWLPATQAVAEFIRTNRPDYKEIETGLSEKMLLFQKVHSDRRRWFNFTNFNLPKELRK